MEPLRVSLCRKIGYLEPLGLAEPTGRVVLLLAAAFPSRRVHRPELARVEEVGLAGDNS